ncbi:MAG: CRISPR-associated endonuclease Cas2 [Patescibacteria group bacterium]
MAKRNFNYGELTKGILTYFADTLTTGYSSIQGRKGANLPLLIDNLQELLKSIKNYQAKKIKVLRALKKLEKKEILDLQERDGKVVVYLKNENHPKIIEYSIKILLDFKKKNKQWNGKWFLVFFDVPETQRNKRDYLRRYLIKLGFYQYQKSVYLFPYECEKEVELIKKIVEGAKYMKYIIAEKIEDELKAKEYFKLPS